MSDALHDLTVAQLAAKLRAKEVSAVEAAGHFLGRAKSHESLGAYLAIDAEATPVSYTHLTLPTSDLV